MNEELPVDEIFYGLQGEGNRMGFPSVFIRTGGCNLTCAGFDCRITVASGETIIGCDTIHAVNKQYFAQDWSYYTDFKNLVKGALSVVPKNLAYNEEPVDIVFTGGEPLMHHANSIMRSAVKYFLSRGHKVWFETNGTIEVPFDTFPEYRKCSMSMSVKMSASGEAYRKIWKPRVVDNYIQNTEDSYFKFVLSAGSIENESEEIFDFLSKVPSYAPVYCMPLGDTFDKVRENAYEVYEFASRNGMRYSDRLHIRIHNDRRGV
jgi:6-pyruvoyltetrahydropterin 2'-reductase